MAAGTAAFGAADLELIHPKMMGDLVAHGLGDDAGDVLAAYSDLKNGAAEDGDPVRVEAVSVTALCV